MPFKTFMASLADLVFFSNPVYAVDCSLDMLRIPENLLTQLVESVEL